MKFHSKDPDSLMHHRIAPLAQESPTDSIDQFNHTPHVADPLLASHEIVRKPITQDNSIGETPLLAARQPSFMLSRTRGFISQKALTTLGGSLVAGITVPLVLKATGIGFVEAADWGMNAKTAVFFGTMVLTALGTWGRLEQLSTIKKKNSVENLPLAMNTIFTAVSWVILLNGIETNRAARIISAGAAGLCSTLILAEILKRDSTASFSKKIAATAAMIGVPTIMGLLPNAHQRELFYEASLFIDAIIPIQQTVQLARKGTAGAVEPKLLCTSLISNAFWISYGIFQKDPKLIAYSSSLFASSLASLGLWIKYSKTWLQNLGQKAKAKYQGESPRVERDHIEK